MKKPLNHAVKSKNVGRLNLVAQRWRNFLLVQIGGKFGGVLVQLHVHFKVVCA